MCSHNGSNYKGQGTSMYIYIIVKSEKAETKRYINILITTVKLCNYMDRRRGKIKIINLVEGLQLTFIPYHFIQLAYVSFFCLLVSVLDLRALRNETTCLGPASPLPLQFFSALLRGATFPGSKSHNTAARPGPRPFLLSLGSALSQPLFGAQHFFIFPN